MVNETERRLTRRIEVMHPPKQKQLRLLYATASPQGGARVDEDIRRVEVAVKASTRRDQVKIKHL